MTYYLIDDNIYIHLGGGEIPPVCQCYWYQEYFLSTGLPYRSVALQTNRDWYLDENIQEYPPSVLDGIFDEDSQVHGSGWREWA